MPLEQEVSHAVCIRRCIRRDLPAAAEYPTLHRNSSLRPHRASGGSPLGEIKPYRKGYRREKKDAIG